MVKQRRILRYDELYIKNKKKVHLFKKNYSNKCLSWYYIM